MLMVYLNNIKDHEYLHPKEGDLVKGILRYGQRVLDCVAITILSILIASRNYWTS